MSKKIGFVIAGIILSVLLLNSVSAYFGGGFYDPRTGMTDLVNIVIDFFEPLLAALFGGETTGYSSYLLFEKLLLFLIILSVTYLSLNNTNFFKNQKGVIWVITIAVPLIAVRFLDFMWLNTILIQYTVLGIALTSILPFIIYLLFLHGASDSGAVRKIGWIFFIVIYAFLWSSATVPSYAEIYFWTILISFIFLFLDGTIHSYFMTERMKDARSAKILEYIGELNQKLADVDYRMSGLTDAQKKALKEDYLKKIKAYQKLL
jgi:hypothetical protein